MSVSQKHIEIPNDFKVQADNMFKELNALIEDVNAKLNSISNSIVELENKLTVSLDGNKN